MANAEIRSHNEYPFACESAHFRRDYVLTTGLQLQQAQPISQASGGPKTMIDDMFAAKLVNIAQSLDPTLTVFIVVTHPLHPVGAVFGVSADGLSNSPSPRKVNPLSAEE
jgi:hypothetical protein